jgi:SCP-2 sterol transfer family
MAEKGRFQQTLERISERLAKSRSMKQGDIVFRLTGAEAGAWMVQCGEGAARVAPLPAAGSDRAPLIEVIGDAARVRAVLAGDKDARTQFLAGGFRVRGDLRYLSDVGLELGLLKEPL